MYKRLDDEKYTGLRKALLKQKGSDLQREFLKVARSDDEFFHFVRSQVDTKGEKETPLLDETLTEHQYKEPTKDTEERMYKIWKDVPPETACRVTFWGEVTLRHIENNRIQSSYLAANGGALSGGFERIDKALSNGGDEKEIDSCVRTMLRRMSGLPEARGNISVYVNCPFGCAWWRERLTDEVCDIIDKSSSRSKSSRDGILNLLRLEQEYWETLVRLVISRNSVLGDRNVRDVLIWSLAETLEVDKKNSVLKSQNLKSLCRLLGVRCAWQELGILESAELKILIDNEISSIAGRC